IRESRVPFSRYVSPTRCPGWFPPQIVYPDRRAGAPVGLCRIAPVATTEPLALRTQRQRLRFSIFMQTYADPRPAHPSAAGRIRQETVGNQPPGYDGVMAFR